MTDAEQFQAAYRLGWWVSAARAGSTFPLPRLVPRTVPYQPFWASRPWAWEIEALTTGGGMLWHAGHLDLGVLRDDGCKLCRELHA